MGRARWKQATTGRPRVVREPWQVVRDCLLPKGFKGNPRGVRGEPATYPTPERPFFFSSVTSFLEYDEVGSRVERSLDTYDEIVGRAVLANFKTFLEYLNSIRGEE